MLFSSTSLGGSIPRSKFEVGDEHDKFISRIKQTFYYGKLPRSQRFSLPVSEIAAELFTEAKHDHSIQRLDLGEAATFSRKASMSPCSLVLALLYLDRLKSRDPEYLQRVAPSELFVVSMMVATKFLHDDGEDGEVFNDEWALLAGVDVKEMNRSERDFLEAIGWEVFVNGDGFWKRLCGLEKDIALREGKKRGWFSYTDLDLLMEQMDLVKLAHAVISVSAVCLTSYTASVLTLIGSALIVSHIPGTTLSSSLSSPLKNFPVKSNVVQVGAFPENSSMYDLPLATFIRISVILESIKFLNSTENTPKGTDSVGLLDKKGKVLDIPSHKSFLQNGIISKHCKDFNGNSISNNIVRVANYWMPGKESWRNNSGEVSCTIITSNNMQVKINDT